MQNHNQYCLKKTKASKSSFYFSFCFLNEKQKQAITAIYAFCREVDDIVDECREESIAFKKISWWQEEVNRTFANKATHPIGKALVEARSNFKIEKQHLLDMLDGMIMDLKYNSYDTEKDLEKYCYCVASTVGLLVTDIFGYRNTKTLAYAKDMGLALQLVNIIRDVGEDARRGRIYIPLDNLKRFGIRHNEILDLMDEKDERFTKLMQGEFERACNLYNRAINNLVEEDRAKQLPGIIMANIYFTLLDEIKRAKFPVMHHKVSLTPVRKVWIALKTFAKERFKFRKKYKLDLA